MQHVAPAYMEVRLPKIGESASAVVVSILVRPGDVIATGQTVLEIENEKAIAPIPSPSAGKVTEVRVKEGQKIAPGTVILVLEGATVGAPAPAAPPTTAGPAPARAAAAAAPVAYDDDDDHSGPDETAETGPIPPASPYVRKVARDLGLRLSGIRPTGSRGQLTIEDLGRHVARLQRKVARAGRYAEEPAGLVFEPVNVDFSLYGPVTSEPLGAIRKVIAARMVENSVSIPHVTQFDEADMTRIEALRATHKAAYEKAGARLTPTPFLLHALVSVLKRHPRFNASVNDVAETLVLKHYVHLGIAVDTDAGLLVPVIRDADKKSLLELALELTAIASKARDRKVTPDEMRGGSFTVSNQGAIGGGHFTPIVNKPEVAILGLGKSRPKPVVLADGRIEARPMLPLAVSYDHRIIDGGAAARFTVDLVAAIADFQESAVRL
ncbi:MAG: dihydrolipoamide acetyltransferase [Verrucomicrobia bacterium]|nr:MAG: dihydrolipoamide acetyltransferase [Verrucomicrobiota bacterium]